MVSASYCLSLHAFSTQCSTKNAPTRWTRNPWGWFSPGCPPPCDDLSCGSPEHASLREQIPPRLALTVGALYSQPPLFSDLPGAVSTLVQTARPTQCVPRQTQSSSYSKCTNSHPQSGSALQTPTHPLLSEPCSCPGCALQTHACGYQREPGGAYQVCSHPASVCLVDHVSHGICPDVMTLRSQRRTVAF